MPVHKEMPEYNPEEFEQPNLDSVDDPRAYEDIPDEFEDTFTSINR